MYVCKRRDGWYVMSNGGKPDFGPVLSRAQAEEAMRRGILLFRRKKNNEKESRFILHHGMLEKIGTDGYRQLAKAVGDDVSEE